MLDAQVAPGDPGYGLTELHFPGGTLLVPRLDHPAGTRVRVRVRSRDISIALQPPVQSSVLNAIPASVVSVTEDDVAQADVVLDAGGSRLLARITHRSVAHLNLVPGARVFALIKAASVDRPSIQATGLSDLPPPETDHA